MHDAVVALLKLLEIEQHHEDRSPYRCVDRTAPRGLVSVKVHPAPLPHFTQFCTYHSTSQILRASSRWSWASVWIHRCGNDTRTTCKHERLCPRTYLGEFLFLHALPILLIMHFICTVHGAHPIPPKVWSGAPFAQVTTNRSTATTSPTTCKRDGHNSCAMYPQYPVLHFLSIALPILSIHMASEGTSWAPYPVWRR